MGDAGIEDEWFARGEPEMRSQRTQAGLPYTERGGVWVKGATMLQGFSATWPFAVIQVEPGKVTVRALGDEFVFHPGSRTSVHGASGLFSRGVRFESDAGSEPLTVTFWSFSYSRLHSAIKHAGF